MAQLGLGVNAPLKGAADSEISHLLLRSARLKQPRLL